MKTITLLLLIWIAGMHTTLAQFAPLRYVVHPQAEAHLGADITLNGDWAFIAAPNEDVDNFKSTGAVYVYHWQNNAWTYHQKLTADTLYDYRMFGQSLASYGSHVAIGSIHTNNGTISSGSVFLFELVENQWQYLQQLYPDEPEHFDQFGRNVAINQSYLLVSAHAWPHADFPLMGSVYVYHFEQGQWVQRAQLEPDQKEYEMEFGRSIAINERNQVFVGAPSAAVADSLEGAVFLFEPSASGWTQKARLSSPQPLFRAFFGSAIAATNEYVLIGAPGDHHEDVITGKAYLFREHFNAWQHHLTLVPDEDQSQMKFGSSVAMSEQVLMVGARRFHTATASSVGRVYVYHGPDEHFAEIKPLDHPLQQEYAFFGASLALSRHHVIVGAHGTDYSLDDAGVSYFYEVSQLVSTRTEQPHVDLPTRFEVSDNYPNPFNPSTNISLSLPEAQHITLEVFDILGRRVQVVTNQSFAAGYHTLSINAAAWSSGTYIYRLRTSQHGIITKKMMLVK